MKKLLFITPQIPIPANSGGLISTLDSLKYLCKHFEVDYISFYNAANKNIAELENKLKLIGVNNIYFIDFTVKSKNIVNIIKATFTKLPLSIYRNHSNKMIQKISEIGDYYDILYADHWLSMQFIPANYNKTVILKEHNAEYVMWERLEKKETNPIKKLYLKNEIKKIKQYESKICNRATYVITVTDEDKQKLYKINGSAKHITMLPAIIINNPNKNISSFYNRENALMYVGTMSWDANIDGLSYFLKNIYPSIKQNIPDIKFYIIGKNPPEIIKNYSYTDSSIIITGFVDDLKEYFNKCKIFIVYLRYGSGIKIKILESLANGLPVISNEIGLEGIKTQGVIGCKADNDFIDKIVSLIDNNKTLESMSEHAINYIEKNYSEELYNNFYKTLI